MTAGWSRRSAGNRTGKVGGLHPDDARFIERTMIVVGALIIAAFVAFGEHGMAVMTVVLGLAVALGWRLLRRHSLF
jgi:hypothetical protein